MINSTAEHERLSRQLSESAEAAFLRKGRIERAFRIDGRCFVMRFAGEKIAATMTRALNHLAIAEPTDVSLTIDCWDAASTGSVLPMPEWPGEFFTPRGEVRGLDSPEMRVAYFDWIKLLNVYLPGSGRAFYCIADADSFPVQQLGSPALTIFSWWAGTLGWQFAHTAAVGTERGGVLVVGHGGAGKSTLAFSTLGSPLHYLSDDYCILAPGQPPRALALYNSGKLTEPSLCLHQHLRCHAANADDRTREKAVFFLHESFPGQQIDAAPLRAIVLPQFNSFETSLVPASWREVVDTLAQSTMRQLAGSDNADFLRMMRVARSLPVYRLNHGLSTADTHQLLLQLCAS